MTLLYRQGLLNMVVLLMKYGADPNSMDIEGNILSDFINKFLN